MKMVFRMLILLSLAFIQMTCGIGSDSQAVIERLIRGSHKPSRSLLSDQGDMKGDCKPRKWWSPNWQCHEQWEIVFTKAVYDLRKKQLESGPKGSLRESIKKFKECAGDFGRFRRKSFATYDTFGPFCKDAMDDAPSKVPWERCIYTLMEPNKKDPDKTFQAVWDHIFEQAAVDGEDKLSAAVLSAYVAKTKPEGELWNSYLKPRASKTEDGEVPSLLDSESMIKVAYDGIGLPGVYREGTRDLSFEYFKLVMRRYRDPKKSPKTS